MNTKNNFAVLLLMAFCAGVICSCSKDDMEENGPSSDGVTNGHAWVDLKLPSGTLWATCNIGAKSPDELGDYFAWSMTEPNVFGYSDVSYEYYTDYQTELDPADDAATVQWGENWQTPSIAQLKELTGGVYTTITSTAYGIMITSKNNGKSISLPASGYGNEGGSYKVNSEGFYWSRTPDRNRDYYAQYVHFESDVFSEKSEKRMFGLSVRPVRVQKKSGSTPVKSIKISETSLSLQVGATHFLTATVRPTNATKKNVTWSSNNTKVATVDKTGKVTANAVGLCVITCRATDGSDVKAECQMTVEAPLCPDSNHPHVIDLALPSGTKWCCCNLDANSPEEYGSFFAWGETTPKSNYDESTYTFTANPTELSAGHDAATANWGSSWQMPSLAQIKELYNSSYTTTVWTTQNSVYGRKITSKSNWNSIFLPAAGWNPWSAPYFVSENGYYWSRSLEKSDFSEYAYCLYFKSDRIGSSELLRECGASIRPVRKQ